MAIPNLIVSAVAEWNGKALTKGANQIGKFNQTVKGLGRTLGVTFSAAALLGYSKKAVAAYGEQIAEVKRLDTALRNLGFNFATAEAEGYIDSVERATGVNRDQLQPSFIQLAQTTRSTTMAQSMLNTALDISAGTGMDLASATKILSQAYVGNVKGLKQLNLGLTNAELSSKSYLEIERLIAAQYAGQSKNAADSYQGSLNRLKIAAEQASEQIGQSLVAALSTSSGGMDKLIDKVDGAADSISGLITNVSVLAKDLGDLFSSIPGAGVLENAFRGLKNYVGRFSIGALRTNVDIVRGRQGGFPQGVPQDITNLRTNAEKAKMDKLAIKRQKELLALQKKAELAKKNEISLTKAAAEFDTNRISIAAALKATYDKETRLRLEAMMAIEDENGSLALSKLKELGLLQESNDLKRLAGIKTISDETLFALNARLLAELKVINDSEMAEKDKEIAREAAFKKYNAGIILAGELAAEESYKEATRIQLNQIQKLAALSKTESAARTSILLVQSEELNAINAVRNAQAAADAQRMANLQSYIAALKSLGSVSTGAGALSTSGGVDPALTAAIAAAKKAQDDAVAAKSKLDKATGDAIAAAAAAAESASKIAAESAAALSELADAVAAEKDANAAATLGETSAALTELADALAAELDATGTLGSMPELESLASEGLLPTYTEVPTGGAFDRDYTININAGVIASQDELATLIQDTIQGLNRNGDPLTTASII